MACCRALLSWAVYISHQFVMVPVRIHLLLLCRREQELDIVVSLNQGRDVWWPWQVLCDAKTVHLLHLSSTDVDRAVCLHPKVNYKYVVLCEPSCMIFSSLSVVWNLFHSIYLADTFIQRDLQWEHLTLWIQPRKLQVHQLHQIRWTASSSTSRNTETQRNRTSVDAPKILWKLVTCQPAGFFQCKKKPLRSSCHSEVSGGFAKLVVDLWWASFLWHIWHSTFWESSLRI